MEGIIWVAPPEFDFAQFPSWGFRILAPLGLPLIRRNIWSETRGYLFEGKKGAARSLFRTGGKIFTNEGGENFSPKKGDAGPGYPRDARPIVRVFFGKGAEIISHRPGVCEVGVIITLQGFAILGPVIITAGLIQEDRGFLPTAEGRTIYFGVGRTYRRFMVF